MATSVSRTRDVSNCLPTTSNIHQGGGLFRNAKNFALRFAWACWEWICFSQLAERTRSWKIISLFVKKKASVARVIGIQSNAYLKPWIRRRESENPKLAATPKSPDLHHIHRSKKVALSFRQCINPAKTIKWCETNREMKHVNYALPSSADFNIHVTITYNAACERRNSDQDEREPFHPHDTYVQENIYASISIGY